MPLLMFQNDSNLISIIASVSLSDTHAVTFLAKLTALITHSVYILFGPLSAFLSVHGTAQYKGSASCWKASGRRVPVALSQPAWTLLMLCGHLWESAPQLIGIWGPNGPPSLKGLTGGDLLKVTESNSGRARLRPRWWPVLWFNCWAMYFLLRSWVSQSGLKKSQREIPCWFSGNSSFASKPDIPNSSLLCGFMAHFVSSCLQSRSEK